MCLSLIPLRDHPVDDLPVRIEEGEAGRAVGPDFHDDAFLSLAVHECHGGGSVLAVTDPDAIRIRSADRGIADAQAREPVLRITHAGELHHLPVDTVLVERKTRSRLDDLAVGVATPTEDEATVFGPL